MRRKGGVQPSSSFCRYISNLKRNSPEEYAAALYQFYNDERLVEKLIVNPTSLERPFYQKYDPCVVSYLPRELPDGTFAIAQEHTTDSLQMLLKADFMTDVYKRQAYWFPCSADWGRYSSALATFFVTCSPWR